MSLYTDMKISVTHKGRHNSLYQYITIEARGRAAHIGKQSLPSLYVAVDLVKEWNNSIQWMWNKFDLR